ncbi:T9SS-dependent choice-of-anchor J family protein [Moheibacter stercoris]|uniref:Por secretion system C-terminal sorting domain-containing protein n=1 Tax=Moheibacter stercoris TaxID=1628251 RepID=A0ABV2LQA0_9FLAO
MKKHLLMLSAFLFSILGNAQILTENFDDITTLSSSGWTMTNQSTTVGTTNWFQGNTAVFDSHSGDPTSYIGANYNNTTGSSTISNWLITPTLNVKDGDQLKFWTRTSSGSIYNDRLEVRSSTGTMTLPSGPTGVGSFTNLLLSINENLDLSYPEVWTEYTVTISGVGSTPVAMNLAFRYYVTSGGPSGTNSNFIGIDTLSVVEGEGGGGDECAPVNVPYYQDFESAVTPDMPECTTVENAGSGNNWHTYNGTSGDFTGTYLRYQWNSANPANSWFYTQGINLTAGTAYKVTYDYGTYSAGTFPESLKVAYGTENTHTAMTNVLATHEDFVTDLQVETNVVEFTATTSGVYYFGFNAFSDANMFYLYLDNIKVELAEEIAEECEWTITVEGPFFGDEISWEFRDADGTVLLSGGEYDDIGFSDVQTITAAGPVEFYIEAFGNFDDNEVSYEIKNANGIQASGSLDGGDDATHSDMNCDDEGEDPTYCIPDLDCTDGDVITNVVFQEINNPTSCSPNGYGDYTSMIANVEAGNSYPINVTVGSGWAYESVSVWIDYNNNMVFEESEFTYVGTGSGSVVSGNIAIPAGTADGEYRMRVRVAAVGETSATWHMACDETQGYGETEDYTVNVGTLGLPSMANNSFAYYPNPTTGLVNISSAKTIENVQVYNLLGQEVLTTSKVANGQINVQALTSGTYIFRVSLEGGIVETFKIIKK